MQLDIPSPPPLPSPPLLTHYTVENPWPVCAVLVLATVVAFSVFHQRGDVRRGVLVALPLAVCAVGVAVLARVITTPREAIARAARTLVKSVAECDTTVLESSLDDTCTLYYYQVPSGLPREGIADAVSTTFAKGAPYRLAGWQIESLQVRTTGPTSGQAQIKVLARPEQWNLPHLSWWRVDYRKGADAQWRASAIMPLHVQGVDNPGGR